MAVNLLSNPLLWTDDSGNCPPSYWDGTKYVFNTGGTGIAEQTITLNSAATAGDIAAATFDNLAPIVGTEGGFGQGIIQLVDTNLPDSPYYSNTDDTASIGSWAITTNALNGGEMLQFFANSQFSSGYAYDFTLTPTGDPTPPVGGCFWTDFVGCAEDCSDVPPPLTGTFNLHTWNMVYQIGCCPDADDSCVQTNGEPDTFGDVPAMPDALNVPGGTTLSPTMGTVQLLVPVVSLSRGTPPGCTSTLPAPRIRATVHLTPPAGGTPDWDFLGAFNTVPSLSGQAYIYDTAGGEDEPVLTGDQFGDINCDTSGTPWVMTVLLDVDLLSNSMPNTETASVGVRFTYTGSDSSGTPIVVESVALNVEATCPC